MLTIRHINGDCGPFLDGNTYDAVAVLDNGEPVATVCYFYNPGTIRTRVEIDCHDLERVALLPGVHGHLHLLSLVTKTILEHFTEDHEFYCDAFADEDGEPRDLIIAL